LRTFDLAGIDMASLDVNANQNVAVAGHLTLIYQKASGPNVNMWVRSHQISTSNWMITYAELHVRRWSLRPSKDHCFRSSFVISGLFLLDQTTAVAGDLAIFIGWYNLDFILSDRKGRESSRCLAANQVAVFADTASKN